MLKPRGCKISFLNKTQVHSNCCHLLLNSFFPTNQWQYYWYDFPHRELRWVCWELHGMRQMELLESKGNRLTLFFSPTETSIIALPKVTFSKLTAMHLRTFCWRTCKAFIKDSFIVYMAWIVSGSTINFEMNEVMLWLTISCCRHGTWWPTTTLWVTAWSFKVLRIFWRSSKCYSAKAE